MTTINYRDIVGALETKLAALSGVPAIAYENENYTPTLGTPYLRVYNVPSIALPETLGTAAKASVTGIFYIDCIYPAGEGRGDADEMSDLIINHFENGTSVSQNGVNTRIISSGRQTSQSDTDWFLVPVRVQYQSWFN